MRLHKYTIFSSIFVFFIVASPTQAAETAERNILSIGCQKEKGVCTVQLNGDAVGSRNCASNTLQFNTLTDKNADAVLSLLTAAFFANKKVRFDISEQCGNQDTMPTFESFRVLN